MIDGNEREHLIKQIRVAVLHDIQMALAQLMTDRMGRQDEVRNAAKVINHYVGPRIGEVTDGTADRPHINP